MASVSASSIIQSNCKLSNRLAVKHHTRKSWVERVQAGITATPSKSCRLLVYQSVTVLMAVLSTAEHKFLLLFPDFLTENTSRLVLDRIHGLGVRTVPFSVQIPRRFIKSSSFSDVGNSLLRTSSCIGRLKYVRPVTITVIRFVITIQSVVHVIGDDIVLYTTSVSHLSACSPRDSMCGLHCFQEVAFDLSLL